MADLRRLVIFGAGGLGSEVAASVHRINQLMPTFEFLGFCDEDVAKRGSTCDGVPVLGSAEEVNLELELKLEFVCAVGNNRSRKSLVAKMLAMGWEPTQIVDPSVIVRQALELAKGVTSPPGRSYRRRRKLAAMSLQILAARSPIM
jgi:FlaA1/EpsC-like NDP-sugar epimerase